MDFKSPSLRWLLAFDAAFLGSGVALWVFGRPTPALSVFAAACLLAVWQLALLLRRWRRREGFPIEQHIKKQHYLQAFVQGSHYVYWGCYWDQVRIWAPMIAVQFLFAYLLDALLSWSRGRSWQIGFGPLPIVGSINLFLWFREDHFYLQLLLVATAYFAKEFITWERDGRRTHVFNPSAIALATAGVALMATRTVHLSQGVDLINSFYLPPNFFEFMFLFGLLLQVFFATTLVTWGAFMTQCAVFFGFKLMMGHPITAGPVDIAVFLGLNLLVTDPSTSPKSKAGKLLFGLTYGGGVFLAYALLRYASQPSYLDKILVVPIMNLLAVRFDVVAGQLFGRWSGSESRLTSLLSNRYCHMALYAGLFLAVLTPLKYRDPSVIDPFPPHAFLPSREMRELQARAIAFRLGYPQVYQKFGFLSEALYFEDYSVHLKQDTVVSHIRLGDACLHLGLRDLAIRHFERAREIDPTNTDATQALKYALEQQADSAG